MQGIRAFLPLFFVIGIVGLKIVYINNATRLGSNETEFEEQNPIGRVAANILRKKTQAFYDIYSRPERLHAEYRLNDGQLGEVRPIYVGRVVCVVGPMSYASYKSSSKGSYAAGHRAGMLGCSQILPRFVKCQ